MSVPLWELETSWFLPAKAELSESNYTYSTWNDFISYSPYQFWKPYVLTSWSWKKVREIPRSLRRQSYEETSEQAVELEKLQIVFLSSTCFQPITCVEMYISKLDEPYVREWLKSHMPKFWKI